MPRLVARTSRSGRRMEAYEIGLCVWNDSTSRLRAHRRAVDEVGRCGRSSRRRPTGHPAFWKDAARQGVGAVRQPAAHAPLPGHVRGLAGLVQPGRCSSPRRASFRPRDGKPVKPHSGSIAWNAFRKRWVTVFMQAFGKPSVFGELWYAEADDADRPLGQGRQGSQPRHYTFYNPCSGDSSNAPAKLPDDPGSRLPCYVHQIIYRLTSTTR